MKKYILSILLFLPLCAFSLTVVKVIVAEYRVWYVYSDGSIRGYSNNGGTFIKNWGMPAGVTSWSYVTAGFNYLIAIDQLGRYWYTKVFFDDPTDGFYQVATDSTGASISGITYANSYSASNMYIAADGSLWYGGVDCYSFWYPGGSVVFHSGTTMNYTQLSAPGLAFTKISMGGTVIMALCTDGSVYKWVAGNRTPTHYTTPRSAVDVFAGAVDAWGYIMPDATGDPTMGYPYMAGTQFGLWGGSGTLSTPTSIKSLWNMTVPIREFYMDWNAIHYIDSTRKLWGCGWNPFGQIGNGQEFVGRYNYVTYGNPSTWYAWSFTNGENATGGPVQIGTDIDWNHIWGNPWFGFYNYASKTNDSLYSWGRNKSNILGNGFSMNIWTPDGSNVDEFHFDAVDIIAPTRVTPINARTQTYNVTPPNVDAANQSISTSSTTISITGHMLKVFAVSQPAANGVDTICCSISSHLWTQISGPNTATLTNATSPTVTVSNMINGTYTMQDLISDNNSGQDTVRMQISVSLSAGINSWIHKRKFKSRQL